MPAPAAEAATAYLATAGAGSWSQGDVNGAYAAEKAAQARRCRVPADDGTWPADLVEALFRRIAVNLALRSLPLAVSASIGEAGTATNRVGGRDPEVTRLEAPYRKLVKG